MAVRRQGGHMSPKRGLQGICHRNLWVETHHEGRPLVEPVGCSFERAGNGVKQAK